MFYKATLTMANLETVEAEILLRENAEEFVSSAMNMVDVDKIVVTSDMENIILTAGGFTIHDGKLRRVWTLHSMPFEFMIWGKYEISDELKKKIAKAQKEAARKSAKLLAKEKKGITVARDCWKTIEEEVEPYARLAYATETSGVTATLHGGITVDRDQETSGVTATVED